MKRKKPIVNLIEYGILILVGCAFALPLIWLVLASVDTKAGPMITMIDEFTLDNFTAILRTEKYQLGFLNSFIYSVAIAGAVLLGSITAACPLSRYHIKGAQKIALSMLFLSSIPAMALIVPTYKIFVWTKLIYKPVSLICFQAACGLPFAIWMMKNFFDAVPRELEEAAWVDGAGRIASMRKVLIPLMVPGIFTVTIYTFINAWSSFTVPYILLNHVDTLPASVLVYAMFGEHGQVNYGHLAAYCTLYMLPVLVLYTGAQNYMSKGFSMSGASKS